MTCKNPVDFQTLAVYWLGEMAERQEVIIEEHFFGCAHCTGRLDAFAALASGVRAAVKDGRVTTVVSEPFVKAMTQAGLSLREYRIEPGGSVNCTIRADEDGVISRIRAPLAGVKRLDLAHQLGGEPETRIADVPFDAKTGELLIIQSGARLKAMPAFVLRTRLIAVDEAGERQIGDYTFNHSPSLAPG